MSKYMVFKQDNLITLSQRTNYTHLYKIPYKQYTNAKWVLMQTTFDKLIP
jgi:hypothetical protein